MSIERTLPEQIEYNDKWHDKMQESFDRHLEIYSNNGRELAGLKKEVELSRKDLEHIRGLLESSVEKQGIKISALENWKWWIMGIGSVVIFSAGFMIYLINSNLDYKIQMALQEELAKYEVIIK